MQVVRYYNLLLVKKIEYFILKATILRQKQIFSNQRLIRTVEHLVKTAKTE